MLTATQIRDLARRYEVRPSKTLGQNFIIDANTIRRIIRLSQITTDDLVVEVGAGFGSLTLGLADAARSVVAVEFDSRLSQALQEVCVGLSNVEIVHADALGLDHSRLFGGSNHRVIANLPYNIATPLVGGWLQDHPTVDDMVVMVQKEVGERLVASPGSKAYGSISVLVAYHCRGQVLGKIPRAVFWPPPAVESVLIRLTRRDQIMSVDQEHLMRVVRAAFAQRRKTVKNSLMSVFEGEEVDSALNAAGVDPGVRGESLDLEAFVAIAEALR